MLYAGTDDGYVYAYKIHSATGKLSAAKRLVSKGENYLERLSTERSSRLTKLSHASVHVPGFAGKRKTLCCWSTLLPI